MGWWADHCSANPKIARTDCANCTNRTCHVEGCGRAVLCFELKSGRTRQRVKCEECRWEARVTRREGKYGTTTHRDSLGALGPQEAPGGVGRQSMLRDILRRHR